MMKSLVVASRAQPPSRSDDAQTTPALGLRLLALAVVAGSGALLLETPTSRAFLAAGILASALLGWLQSVLSRRGHARVGKLLVLVQLAVWIYLLHSSGGQRSPLFIGLLLEVPLAGSLHGRRGSALAGVAGAGAYLAYAILLPTPLELDTVALVTVSFAAATALTWILLGIFDRQRAAIASVRSALAARAESLDTELHLMRDSLGSAFLSVNDMGCLVSVNQAGTALLGLDGRPAIGRPWQEILRPDPPTAACIARTLAEGEAQRDVPMVFHDGDGVPVALRGDLWVSPSQDRWLMHLLLDRRSGTEATDDPVHRMGEAAACVAHQFKNSLHALRGLAPPAEGDSLHRDRALDARRFLGALRSLSELTDDMLAVAGAARPPAEHIALAHAVSSALLLAQPGAARVTVDQGAEEVCVWTARGPLVHALFNLIDNACRATPPGGTVHVRMRSEGGCASVDIVDGGPGLPPGVDGSRRPVQSREGSGLGLVAARRFLEASGGGVSFAAAPDGGTVCRVTLPMRAAQAARPVGLDRV